MKTGFYDLSKLTLPELNFFFNDAMMMSYDTHVEILDCNISWSREICKTKTIKEMMFKISLANHNICIDRSIQHNTTNYGEIGFSTSSDPNYFLYIHVNLDNFKKLVEKYNLIQINND